MLPNINSSMQFEVFRLQCWAPLLVGYQLAILILKLMLLTVNSSMATHIILTATLGASFNRLWKQDFKKISNVLYLSTAINYWPIKIHRPVKYIWYIPEILQLQLASKIEMNTITVKLRNLPRNKPKLNRLIVFEVTFI